MTTLHYLIETLCSLVDLAATLLELAWLYLQLYALRAEIATADALRWIVTNPDQSAAAATGLCGAFMLARKGPWARIAWLAFLTSNGLWIWYAWHAGAPALLVQQIGFAATSLLGVWTWFLQPLGRAPADLKVRKVSQGTTGDGVASNLDGFSSIASGHDVKIPTGYTMPIHRKDGPDLVDCDKTINHVDQQHVAGLSRPAVGIGISEANFQGHELSSLVPNTGHKHLLHSKCPPQKASA